MMQVKKYRAATTRAALEQIKRELGENALVLETRSVQNRRFLGLKAQSQVEISAAAPAFPSEQPAVAKKADSFISLNLKEETIAAPKISAAAPDFEKPSAPAFISTKTSKLAVAEIKDAQSLNAVLPKIEPVEISPDAPRIIHPKRETVKQKEITALAAAISDEENIAEQEIAESKPTAVESPSIINRELELLRAELRELKFSLGAFAARRNVAVAANFAAENQSEIFDSGVYESVFNLIVTGITPETSRRLVQNILPACKSGEIKESEMARVALFCGMTKDVKFEADPLAGGKPSILAMIGATGVGKTTTLAKLAARVALREGRRVELVTLDTYRIAAVEQLKTYAEIIGAGCSVVRSTLELDAHLRRFSKDATVLIDTTGRSPYDLADQFELCDYLKNRPEIRKCLAVQATTNLADGVDSIRKFAMYGADCLAITKLDETTRPGAMFELAAESGLPLAYLAHGQRVPEDLLNAAPESFIARIFGEKSLKPLSLN